MARSSFCGAICTEDEDCPEGCDGTDNNCDGLDDDDDGDGTPDGDCYIMGSTGGACAGKCSQFSLDCIGGGSVGLDCREYQTYANCMKPGYWIMRHWGEGNPNTKCFSSWGTCDVCTLNYNTANQFCCHCATAP